ncbi:hypothetical protein DV495_002111 [Geotrichum candidum]|uniref:Chorismate mutase n=1 Tax=Geotrichum candidum TaxID=1173061 RepID=A0A0J9XBC1_GEOCN|nr:hypothetical protein DV454_005071 [Geotrichum candidum]KAI9212355.1 hypothetical protein DS838_002787 [Geotrichum bryndzae]KAF5109621.1 hypothetical protein DV453_001540 [Geotrichum candidum]KAF5111279.1 hypothetical protein DV452_004420 [Geotrichum candidum]KAF5131605.1 hypothetical protein DV495_002111 [Geotrichum candidum]
MDFKKPETVLDLNNIRVALIRMEDTILFDLIERAQFYTSPAIYDASQLTIPGTNKSLLDFLLLESEKTHALVRRYEAPDELPFFPDEIPEPILPANDYSHVLASYESEININSLIKDVYTKEIVPLVSAGDVEQAENYGSTAICDIEVLQALSRRIHFGKFVAEAKYQSEKERFRALIEAQDSKGIDAAITNAAVEAKVLERLEAKAETYGVDPTLRWSQKSQGKIDKKIARQIYEKWVIPLTKKVEVDYLLRRLEDEKEA